MSSPIVTQGTLNRILTSIIVPSLPNLNITSGYMGKSFAHVSFEGAFDELIGTGTGAVNSPEPYVFATISVGVLRTQALSAAWISQVAATSNIGNVTAYGDSAAFPSINLLDCVISGINPGAFDGTDPVAMINIRGVYRINNNLWTV